jgi:hypothetical protein
MGLDEGRRSGSPGSSLLHQTAQWPVAEYFALQGEPACPVYPLSGVTAGEGDHALEETIGADTPVCDGSLSPVQCPGSDALSPREQISFIGCLAGWLVRGPMLISGVEGAGGRPGVNPHTFPLIVDSNQAIIPAGTDFLTYQTIRHRIEGSAHFHMTVGMDGAGADFEEAEAFLRQRFQRRFLHLQELGIHLLARGTVNAYPGYGAVPALQEGSKALQAVKTSSFEGVVF